MGCRGKPDGACQNACRRGRGHNDRTEAGCAGPTPPRSLARSPGWDDTHVEVIDVSSLDLERTDGSLSTQRVNRSGGTPLHPAPRLVDGVGGRWDSHPPIHAGHPEGALIADLEVG